MALERRFAVRGQRALWYIVSDVPHFRKHAVDTYGGKVLTIMDENITHIDELGDQNHEKNLRGLELAVAENWLYSLTNFQIMAPGSSFSMSAALMGQPCNSLCMTTTLLPMPSGQVAV